jgi:KDO2-lipid IV(A) lauroyltransferase
MKAGGLFMTAHYGNYEAIGPWLCKMGIRLKASYARIKPLFLNKILENKVRAANNESYSIFINNPKNILELIDEGKFFV